MRMQNPFQQEILIRLTEDGFIETIRRFSFEKSLAYELDARGVAEDATSDARLIFARVRPKGNKRSHDA